MTTSKQLAGELASHLFHDLYRAACVGLNCGLDKDHFIELAGGAYDRAKAWSETPEQDQ